jgi:hypothetical protein
MASRYYSAVAQDTTITSGITLSSTTVTVASTTGYPGSFPFVLALDYNTASEELVTVTAISGLTLTITRGYNGTAATGHATGAVVRHVITAQDLTDAQTHYGTTLASGAHGVTGALATFLGTPTSANLGALITDETGSGNLVFSTGPSLSGPTLASPTITGTVNAGGNTGSSGQFLSSTGSGVAWATVSSGGVSTLDLSFNAQTGTTYTLVASDTNKLVTASNASAITITIPPSVFSTGNQVHVQQIGAGQVTFAAGSGVTITSAAAAASRPSLSAQYAAATVICTGTNTFTIIGGIV